MKSVLFLALEKFDVTPLSLHTCSAIYLELYLCSKRKVLCERQDLIEGGTQCKQESRKWTSCRHQESGFFWNVTYQSIEIRTIRIGHVGQPDILVFLVLTWFLFIYLLRTSNIVIIMGPSRTFLEVSSSRDQWLPCKRATVSQELSTWEMKPSSSILSMEEISR